MIERSLLHDMNDDEIADKFDALIEAVELNRRWLRVLAWNDVQETTRDALQEDWEYHLYEMIDGESSTRALAENLPKSRSTIMDRLDRWKQMGIVVQLANSKYEKIVSLEVLNIDLPELE